MSVLSADIGTSHVGELQWSADGSEIAFIRQGRDGRQIVAIRVDDGTERHLLDATDLQTSGFSWSPDGTELLIWPTVAGQIELRRYFIDTGDYILVSTDHQVLNRAVWSPDGLHAALIAHIPGTTRPRLWILDLATGETDPIDRRPGYPQSFAWSGQYLIYTYQVTIPGSQESIGPTLMRWNSLSGERTTIDPAGPEYFDTISAPRCIN